MTFALIAISLVVFAVLAMRESPLWHWGAGGGGDRAAVGARFSEDAAISYGLGLGSWLILRARRDHAGAQRQADPQAGADHADLWRGQIHPAARQPHRAGSARCRHGGLGCGAVFGPPGLEQAQCYPAADADGGGAGVSRQRDRSRLLDDRRLGHSQQSRRSVARALAVSQGQGLPRHADRQGAWRARLFGAGAVDDRFQDRQPFGGGGDHGDGAQFARAGRTAGKIRHARRRRKSISAAWPRGWKCRALR